MKNNESLLYKTKQFDLIYICVTVDHKTSLKCQFFEIEIYTQSESWRNKLSI